MCRATCQSRSFTSRASSAQSVPAAKYTIPACTFRYFLHAATSSAAFAGEASVSLKKTLWASGGGTVVLGPGCLCFTLVLAYDRDPALHDIGASYRSVLGRVAGALASVAAATPEGTSDLAVNGVKISGNAQQRKRNHFLHHGTLLC